MCLALEPSEKPAVPFIPLGWLLIQDRVAAHLLTNYRKLIEPVTVGFCALEARRKRTSPGAR